MTNDTVITVQKALAKAGIEFLDADVKGGGAKFQHGHVTALVELAVLLKEGGMGSADNVRDFARSVVERLAD
jgi:hypothetical protein